MLVPWGLGHWENLWAEARDSKHLAYVILKKKKKTELVADILEMGSY